MLAQGSTASNASRNLLANGMILCDGWLEREIFVCGNRIQIASKSHSNRTFPVLRQARALRGHWADEELTSLLPRRRCFRHSSVSSKVGIPIWRPEAFAYSDLAQDHEQRSLRAFFAKPPDKKKQTCSAHVTSAKNHERTNSK